MADSPCDGCVNRRRFLEKAAQSIAATISAPTLASLAGCGSNKASSQVANLPVIPNNPSNTYTFNFSSYSQLQNAGGSLLAQVQATSGSVPVAILRVSSTAVAALDIVCTHQGCTLSGYDSGAQTLSCPCHGSVFRADGSVANGPATQSLKTYAAQLGASSITATIP